MLVGQVNKTKIELKLDKFEGPLDLLLQLIEQQKLPITELAIGQVTEQYLQTLRTIEGGMHPEILADFLVVAARLLYLKSKTLFPNMSQSEEEEGLSLEEQLRVYQRFVEAAKAIAKLFHRREPAFARESLKAENEVVFSPPARLTRERLREVMLSVVQGLRPLVEWSKEVIQKTVSLREVIHRLQSFLAKYQRAGFAALLREARDRTEIVVTFLAVLELVKQRSVVVQQEAMFGEMTVISIQKSKIKNQKSKLWSPDIVGT